MFFCALLNIKTMNNQKAVKTAGKNISVYILYITFFYKNQHISLVQKNTYHVFTYSVKTANYRTAKL